MLYQGIKVKILGSKLAVLLQEESKNSFSSAEFFGKSLQEASEKDAFDTEISPYRSIKVARDEEYRKANALEFLSDHVDVRGDYILDEDDLVRLGFIKRYK